MDTSGTIYQAERLAEFCRVNNAAKLDVFGSASRTSDFDAADSDFDFLVSFKQDVQSNIANLFALEDALVALLGRPVDLIERKVLERSHNYLRRKRILSETQTIFG